MSIECRGKELRVNEQVFSRVGRWGCNDRIYLEQGV
jgi:hypothetical protein